MKYQPSLFNVTGAIAMIISIGFTIFKWKDLSYGEGWGAVGMFGLMFCCVCLFIVDYLLQFFIKNIWLVNAVEIIIFLVLFTLSKP